MDTEGAEPVSYDSLPKFDIVLNEYCPCIGIDEEPFPTILKILKEKLTLFGYYMEPIPIPSVGDEGPCVRELEHIQNLRWMYQREGTYEADAGGSTFYTFNLFRKSDFAPPVVPLTYATKTYESSE